MQTWHQGRSLVHARLVQESMGLDRFLASAVADVPRVPGVAVFLTARPQQVPHALLHNLKHNRVLHERVVFLTAVPRDVPHVDAEDSAEIRDLTAGCYSVKVYLGFKDSYDIADIARTLDRQFEFKIEPSETSFFLSRETVLAGRPGGMADWRERFFGWMMRSAQPASDFFRIPSNRVIEIGTQIVI